MGKISKQYYPNSSQVKYGSNITPLQRIMIFSEDEWEKFVEEWVDIKKDKYFRVERFGGAGDMGRDVVGYIEDPKDNLNYVWDCYQCKHYDKPLTPSQVYVEFAKIIYYTFKREFPVPRKYYFVSPKDCGTKLSNLLTKPDELKKELKNAWDTNCHSKITSSEKIHLEGDFLKYFELFDFSIFDKVLCKEILLEHEIHPNHLMRFGGGLKNREKFDESTISTSISSDEKNYVENLLEAYNSVDGYECMGVGDLDGKYERHFSKARKCFHYAEQLRVLYRDSLPVGTFEDFQNEVHIGIENEIDKKHDNGFIKVKAVEDKSIDIQIESNPLKDVSKTQDKIGICHQLSNDQKINWKND